MLQLFPPPLRERRLAGLYLEESLPSPAAGTDLAMLQAFARRLGHEEAIRALERPFVRYVGNQPRAVRAHYHGLKEALPRLRGVALFDRLEAGEADLAPVEGLVWRRREIESYVCSRSTLEGYAAASAEGEAPGPLFEPPEVDKRVTAMREAIEEIESALESLGRGSPWEGNVKVSDDFLDPLFRAWFRKLDLPNVMAKKSFHELVENVPFSEIAPEIREKLDAIARVAGKGAAELD